MNEEKQIEMINKNFVKTHSNDSVVTTNFSDVLKDNGFNTDTNIAVEPEIECRANDARFLDGGSFMGEQVVDDRYKQYKEQKTQRSERRLEAQKRRQKIKRAIAIAVVVALGAIGINHVDKQMSDRDKNREEVQPTKVEQQYENSMYDEYVDYVQETNGTLSEEGYKQFAETYSDSSKGAR